MSSQTRFGTGAAKKMSILKAAGIATFAAIFCVGCGDNGGGPVTPPAEYTMSIYLNPVNGGSVECKPSKTTYKAGDTVTVTATAYAGYRFVSWTGVSTSADTAIIVTINANLELTANFEPTVTPPINAYTVTFNANGGAVGPASGTTGADGKLTSLPTPTRSGYTFDGWYTAETGGSAVTASTVFSANAAIYARWTLVLGGSDSTYTITFNANGGTVSPASGTTGAEDGKLASLPTPTRNGYAFDGWYTAATGGSAVTTSTVFSANAAIYARWTPDSGGGDGNLSVNGAQVYSIGGLESNYSGSFDSFAGLDYGSLTDIFTNPTVRMTNGILSINLGVPTGLIHVVNVFDTQDFTISDHTVKILGIDEFIGDGGELMLMNSVSGAMYEVSFIYADKPVIISGSMFGEDVFLDLKKGWSTIVDEYNAGIKNVDVDLSGSGVYKWICGDGDCEDFLTVPAPSATPIPLTEYVLANGSVTSTAFGSAVWYSFNAVSGETYYVLWDDAYSGLETGTLDVMVAAVYSGGPTIFIQDDWDPIDSPSFTADRNGTVLIRVAPSYPGETGTFSVVYGSGISVFDIFSLGLSKSVVKESFRGKTLKRQKLSKDISKGIFKRF